MHSYFKSLWNRFVSYTKYRWENHRETIIKNFIILALVIFLTLLIDLLTKGLLFEWGPNDINGRPIGNGEISYANSFITIKSVGNYGLTFLGGSFLWLAHLSAIIVMLVIPFTVYYFTNSLFLTIILGLLFGGSTGNFIDRLAYNGMVRDIIYFTFLKDVKFFGGIFNFADVFATCSGILGFIFVIRMLILDYKAKH